MENRTKQLNKPALYMGVSIIWALLLSLLLPSVVFSKSTLWKSELNDHTLYLMGSIHVLKESHYPLAPAMEAAYHDSNIVAFEVDLIEMESPSTQQLFMLQGIFQNGQTLQGSISPETYKNLQRYLKTIQLSPNLFARMKPPLCAMTITIMEMQRLGFDAKYGLDRYFSSKAQADGKKIAALETVAFQVNLFFDQSQTEQELFLKQTLTEITLLKGIMQQMEKAWLTGDSPLLHSILFASFAEFPEFYDRLLLQRNRNWITKIKQLHQQNQTSLIIVGAGHLIGKGSVIELLEKQGYRFEQL